MTPVEDLRHRAIAYQSQRAFTRRCFIAVLILLFIITPILEGL
jgi:hypothetical protein